MKLFKKLFKADYKSADKLSDEALSGSILMSVIGIAVCACCLVGLTWAWFTESTVGSVSKIKVANFDLNITVTYTDNNAAENEVYSVGSNQFMLNESVPYTVSIQSDNTLTNTAESGGFYLINLKPGDGGVSSIYYSRNIKKNDIYYFTVSGFSSITLTPMWGTPPDTVTEPYYIECGDTVTCYIPAPVTASVPIEEQTDAEESPPEKAVETVAPDIETESPAKNPVPVPAEETSAPEDTAVKTAESNQNQFPAEETQKPEEEESIATETEATEETDSALPPQDTALSEKTEETAST